MNTKELFSLNGRVAVVTGGSRGIGRMIAEGFVAEGVRVYITARKAEACNRTAQELSREGAPASPSRWIYRPCPVSKHSRPRSLSANRGSISSSTTPAQHGAP